MADTAKHVIFSGRVQGVGFRYTCHRIANCYDLTGFVRNLPDGSVELLVQGHPDDVEDCLTDIRESFSGYIRDTQISEVPVNPPHTDFRIAY
ncbi:MAG TPA: acylphosphatase [Anaerohalosphaeraceae bacterium]|jgi:acylphosphatase|nr:acylphosphatase [Anaerohalosphaeraceae bacterium]HRT49496.1 acylphosphatase [Anaerohalosphaeraceae bacterium]HRT85342.1 acylphosphatase [Anaerohalosphaeraceae bacterium]